MGTDKFSWLYLADILRVYPANVVLASWWSNNVALVASSYGHSSLNLHGTLEIPHDEMWCNVLLHVRGGIANLEADVGFLLRTLAFSRVF